MTNEILLIFSLIFTYSSVLLWFYLFGEKGLLAFTTFVTILANIEVAILIDGFGMEQTLGNILFSASFLATDMISEFYGKKASKRTVYINIMVSLSFIIISKSWLLYDFKIDDGLYQSFSSVFASTPRIILASLVAYAISQLLDVSIYHKWWEYSSKKTGDKRKFLWLRNNGSTLVSQLVNSLLFTYLAFYGAYDNKTVFSIFTSTYIIYIITSILDTPIIYLARMIHDKKRQKD